jgi:molybdate transport system permease protein
MGTVRRPTRVLPWPLGLAAALLLGFLVLPFLALLGALPQTDASAFTARGVPGALATSLLAASVATVVDGVLGIPLALWLATTRSRLRHLVTGAVLLPLAVPPVVGGLELILLTGPNGWVGSGLARLGLDPLDTVAGTILAQMLVAAPFVVIAARAAFAAVDPSMLEAARSLGAGPLAAFRRVLLPAARGGIAAGLVLGWMRCMGEFGATAVVAYHPYTLPTLTYVNLSGEGLRTALPAGALLAAVGAAAGALLLGLDAWRPGRRLSRPAADAETDRVAAGFLDAARAEGPVRLEVRVAGLFGSFRLDVRFAAEASTLALLGPSGAGKSLTLRAIAGLVAVDRGSIRFGDQVLLDTDSGVWVPPERRRLGYVGQRDGLFEHLDVERNIAFGIPHLPATERRLRVDQLLGWMGLERVRLSQPASLSGGERQRAALARALAPGPAALLLDEPFSSVDAARRRELRSLVRTIHSRTEVPVILVTHDREDALDLADQVVVIEDGRVVQEGPLTEVAGRPSTASVARLLGIPNVIAVAALEPGADGSVRALTDWGAFQVEKPGVGLANGAWQLAVPVDAVGLGPGRPNARVVLARPAVGGRRLQLEPVAGGAPLEAVLPSIEHPDLAAGMLCRVLINPDRCHLVRAG